MPRRASLWPTLLVTTVRPVGGVRRCSVVFSAVFGAVRRHREIPYIVQNLFFQEHRAASPSHAVSPHPRSVQLRPDGPPEDRRTPGRALVRGTSCCSLLAARARSGPDGGVVRLDETAPATDAVASDDRSTAVLLLAALRDASPRPGARRRRPHGGRLPGRPRHSGRSGRLVGRVGHWQRGSGRGRPAAGRHRHPHPAHRRPRSPRRRRTTGRGGRPLARSARGWPAVRRPDSEDALLLNRAAVHPPRRDRGRTRPYDATPAPSWTPPQPGPQTNTPPRYGR